MRRGRVDTFDTDTLRGCEGSTVLTKVNSDALALILLVEPLSKSTKVSLIYLAREICRNARAERLASMDTVIRWLRQLTEHPQLSELYYRGIHDFGSLEGYGLRLEPTGSNQKPTKLTEPPFVSSVGSLLLALD